MRLRYLRSADRDLRDIHAFVAERNEVAADRFIAAVHTKIARLAAHPTMGVARADIGPGARKLVAGNYLILYRITRAEVQIVRVVDGRRDLRTIRFRG